MSIVLSNVTKAYGEQIVLNKFSLSAEEGKILCLLGDSGCGKTTILNCISGITPYEGKISNVPDAVSYVFQTERLLKNLTVGENLAYVLGGVYSKQRIAAEIKRLLAEVELAEWENRYPRELSGGMAQRASLARAFCYPSRLLLMDEPFRALDTALRQRLMAAFIRLWQNDPRTVLFVTHDIDEALLLADRVVMLKKDPAHIVYDFTVSGAQAERKLSDEALQSRRSEIYRVLGI